MNALFLDARFWIGVALTITLYCTVRLLCKRYRLSRLVPCLIFGGLTVLLALTAKAPPVATAGAETPPKHRPGPTIAAKPVATLKNTSGQRAPSALANVQPKAPPLAKSGTTAAPPKIDFGTGQSGTVSLPTSLPGQAIGPTGNLFGAGSGGFLVYVIDRSGSMGGERWKKVCQEMIAHLKACPLRKTRVLVRFFSESTDTTVIPANGQARELNTAADITFFEQEIAKVEATGGGTEPSNALFGVLARDPDRVYFLTDGGFNGVDATFDVATLVQKNDNGARIDTFDVGPEQNPLMKEIAAVARGEYRAFPISTRLP